ncbi:hypothetical protein PDG61_09330 [Mycolicibacterium sp. BiH015]|uniref:hypothetical protein n=1 Tax=Mycolicibacterium sp. BiH015 TaxID=3018808 RepID=UPI0022E2E680|nr:hypothetical protein [Mycolicibacterium sp. BiH015]MDA2891113.1 hypothetical protein [Mycolicibacterium sp. BiH015]
MAGSDMNVDLDTVPRMLAARLPDTVDDDPAVIVLGERLYGILVALGVPPGDWLSIARRLDIPDTRAAEALGAYVDVLVADRCHRPGEDLVSDLVLFEAGGRGLNSDELRAIVVGLLMSS